MNQCAFCKTGGHEELKKNQCAFCKEGHWKIDCPKIKPKKESKSEANMAQMHDNDSDSSGYSLSIIPIGCCSEESKWIMDTGTTIMFVPNETGLLVLKTKWRLGVIR